MSDYIDTREGWRRMLAWETADGRDMLQYEPNGDPEKAELWVREVPVPPLPTAPYTVIRVTWKPLDAMRTYEFVLLDGSWRNKHGEVLDPDGVASFEVLSEPRAITAKAVIDRAIELAIIVRRDVADTIRAEFGVES